MATIKEKRRIRIKKGIRKNISGTSSKPRLSVFRSNTEIYAQIIDDVNAKTLVSANSLQLKGDKINKSEKSQKVGEKLAELALAAGITECVFDRNGYLYHGRIKSLAEGARQKGLKI